MKPKELFALILMGACSAGLIVAARAAADDVQALSKEQLAKFDKGPATIDVSAYPAGIQENYAVFRQKCSLCHTLARPINCDFALPDEWSRYIKRMMHKPGSNISPGQAKKIYEFVTYDSSVRKKTMFDDKLSKADVAGKADADARLKEVLAAYPQK
jgi:cytochrome c5